MMRAEFHGSFVFSHELPGPSGRVGQVEQIITSPVEAGSRGSPYALSSAGPKHTTALHCILNLQKSWQRISVPDGAIAKWYPNPLALPHTTPPDMPTIVYQDAAPINPHTPISPPRAESPENANKTPPDAAIPCPNQKQNTSRPLPEEKTPPQTKYLPSRQLGILLTATTPTCLTAASLLSSSTSSRSSGITLRPHHRSHRPGTHNPLPLLALPTTHTTNTTRRRPNPQPLPWPLFPPRTPPHPAPTPIPPTSRSTTTARPTSSSSTPPWRNSRSNSPRPHPPSTSSHASRVSVSSRNSDFDEGLADRGRVRAREEALLGLLVVAMMRVMMGVGVVVVVSAPGAGFVRVVGCVGGGLAEGSFFKSVLGFKWDGYELGRGGMEVGDWGDGKLTHLAHHVA